MAHYPRQAHRTCAKYGCFLYKGPDDEDTDLDSGEPLDSEASSSNFCSLDALYPVADIGPQEKPAWEVFNTCAAWATLPPMYFCHDMYIRVYAKSKDTAAAVVNAVRNGSMMVEIMTTWVASTPMAATDLLAGCFDDAYQPFQVIDPFTDVHAASKASPFTEFFEPPPGYEAAPEAVFQEQAAAFEEWPCIVDVPCPWTQQMLHFGLRSPCFTKTRVAFLPNFATDYSVLNEYGDTHVMRFYARRMARSKYRYNHSSWKLFLDVDRPFATALIDTPAGRPLLAVPVNVVAIMLRWNETPEESLHPQALLTFVDEDGREQGEIQLRALGLSRRVAKGDAVVVQCLFCMPENDVPRHNNFYDLFINPTFLKEGLLYVSNMTPGMAVGVTLLHGNFLREMQGISGVKLSRPAHFTCVPAKPNV